MDNRTYVAMSPFGLFWVGEREWSPWTHILDYATLYTYDEAKKHGTPVHMANALDAARALR
jgi:hypothetical protein